MSQCWAYGAGTVLGVHLLWFVLIFLEAQADWLMTPIIVMSFVTMNVAGVGAFITALCAPRRAMWLAMTMAPFTAALTVASNSMLAVVGTKVDFAGFHGTVGLFAVSLAYGIFVSAVGGAIGTWLARRRVPLTVIVEPAPAALTAEPATVD